MFKIGGVCVKIFPLSDPILLPLAPTIARTIADYLQSIAQKPQIDSLQKDWVRDVIELQPDLDWHGQFQRSIRQIPTSQYQYVSTIAHQLAAKSSLTSLEICQNLDIPIPTLTVVERSVHLELDCWYNAASYIYFQIAPKSIEIWLNYIQYLPLEQLSCTDISTPTRSSLRFSTGAGFPPTRSVPQEGRGFANANDLAIYAHARCCSLLKLAAAEKLVRLTTDWQISTPNWLLDEAYIKNRLTTESNCIFEHPAEQQLIQTLMAVLDVIYSDNRQLDSSRTESIAVSAERRLRQRVASRREGRSSPQGKAIARANAPLPPTTNGQINAGAFNGHRKSPNWNKLTIDLAQSWLEFYRHCQIFGNIKHQNPRREIARCVLTAISRRYLQVLLESYLGVKAAEEL